MDTLTEPLLGQQFDNATYVRLIQGARFAASTELTWLHLEAAHVVGQLHFKPHLQTHAEMLRLSLRTRDWSEAAGQLLRLALVPLGHLSGRLPLGNPGRATVGAFKTLPVRPELAALIKAAREQGVGAR